MGFFDSDSDAGYRKGRSDADGKQNCDLSTKKPEHSSNYTGGRMKTTQRRQKGSMSDYDNKAADLELLMQLQFPTAGAGVMGQPELTIADDPLAELAQLHKELCDNDKMIEERSNQSTKQKVVAMVRDLKQNRGALVRITLETVKEDQTLSRITFQVHPHRIVERGRQPLRKIAVILNEREMKKLRIKANKVTIESLLHLATDQAIDSTKP